MDAELWKDEKSRGKVNFPQILMFFLMDINKETRIARLSKGINLLDMINQLEADLDFARDEDYDKAVEKLDEERDKLDLSKKLTSDSRIEYARAKTRLLSNLMYKKGYLLESDPDGEEFIE